MNEKEAQEEWEKIPQDQKVKLISFYKNCYSKPWEKPQIQFLNYFPAEIIRKIGSILGDDPQSFHAFRGTCKKTREALKNFKDFIPEGYFAPYVDRLLYTAKKKGWSLQVSKKKALEEAYRYATLETAAREKVVKIARIDKLTGLLLDSDGAHPRGKITDDDILSCFASKDGKTVNLLSVHNMRKIKSSYDTLKEKWEREFGEATQDYKALGKRKLLDFDDAPRKKLIIRRG